MLTDLRHALCGFRRSPALTAVAVLSIALGIGANTAIFTLVNAVLLRTLPVPEPDRLVIFTLSTADRFIGSMINRTLYQQIRDNAAVLDGFAAMTNLPMAIAGSGGAEHVLGQLVSGNFFETLGVRAAIGRLIVPDDDRVPGSLPVCVVSYGLWQRRFGGDPAAIGSKVQINGHPFTIIGVTPKNFVGFNQGSEMDISVPQLAAGISQDHFLATFGRLKRGVSREQAQAAIDLVYHRFETIPRSSTLKLADIRVVLQPGSQGFSLLRTTYEKPLRMLMVVVGLLLLIACANVANLLMARVSGREKEIAVRLALGAGRRHLIRQILSESLLLTTTGAALGLMLSYWLDRVLLTVAPPMTGGSILLNVSPDWRVLVFTLLIAILVSVLSGIAAAIQATSPVMSSVLKGAAGQRVLSRISFRNALLVTQVALSLVLLIGAGLFLRSLRNLRSVDIGFDPRRLIVLTLEPGLNGYSQTAIRSLTDRLLQRVRSLPGVVAASPAMISPLSGEFALAKISVPGYQLRPNERGIIATNWIGPAYFKTLGTSLVAGRAFSEQDGDSKKVAIVNEMAAAHYWAHENPIGKHAITSDGDCEIVGVVKNVKSKSLRGEVEPALYLPFRQNARGHVTLHVRVSGETTLVTSALLREIHALDPNLPAYNVTTMERQLDRSIALDRLMGTLTTLFGLLGVVLAAIGLYGMIAFTVTARTREIGIRMALGADSARVLRQVIGESAVLTVMGIALGIPAALWASRALESFLYELKATDPLTYGALAIMLAAVSLSAAWIPSRRAARVDPMVALRYE